MAIKRATPTNDEWTRLRQAPDYRSFLQAYLDVRAMKRSDLARAARFGRGFPGDVISGRRRLTLKSCRAFENGMKLPELGRKLFHYLVAREETELFPELTVKVIEQTIEKLRSAPWNRARRELSAQAAPQIRDVLADPNALAVYAAAGQPGEGADFNLLKQRTGLVDRELEVAALALERAGLLGYRDGRYEPSEMHLFVKTDIHNEVFLTIFQTACRHASERALHSLLSERELFFTSTFCIEEARMPELKDALKKTMLDFVDQAIHPKGDRIVRVVSTLTL